MQKEKLNKSNKGITLVALIITIIVMLILVGVSVTVALNGGLFNTAKNAKTNYIAERDRELGISDGKIEIDGYSSIDEYVNGSSKKVAISPKKETYNLYEAVTIGEESFYVIADDSQKVTLLAKDNIDTTTLVQSASANRVAFSTEKYWEDNEDPIEEPEPTLDAETGKLTLPVSHIAAKAAYDYGEKVGGTGRLMTYSEADALETANSDILSDILYGTNGKSSSTYLRYWLGSAYDEGGVWLVDGSGSSLSGDIYDDDNYCGVRPVVVVLKSNI